ncbi:MAG: hypothetical protein M0Q38_00010 [Bacteroidales bacterium]|jgi:hypothetical protein|nr:hypothetical protein [Bacteroidales bacterium]
MKKYLIIPIMFLFSTGMSAQGIYNNGCAIVVGSGVTLYISGTGGNYRNETNVSSGAIALSGTLKLDGNYTNNVSGADILISPAPGSTVAFTGTTLQTLGGTTTSPFTFSNLTVNNSTGISLSNNAQVDGTLGLTSGLINLGNANLTLGPSTTILGTPSPAAMVVATGAGQLRKQYGGIGSFTFPVGDNNVTAKYSPVSLNFTSGTFAQGAYAGVNLVNAPYPDPYITGSYLNRYWTVTQTGISTFTCDAAFNYNTVDIAGTESSIYCVRISPQPVYPYALTNTVLHQLTASGLTSFGTFTGALGIKYLNLTLFLEGLYNGASTMRQAQGIAGNEFPGITADQLTIELHDPVTYATMPYSIGNIDLNTTGLATIQIPSTFSGSYYVTVKNRNHIATVTSLPISLTNPVINYNFSTSSGQAFGSNLKTLEPGVFGIYGGDANGDGAVDVLDLLAVQNDAVVFASGYLLTDLNGDGAVDVLDLILAQNNALLFVSTINP